MQRHIKPLQNGALPMNGELRGIPANTRYSRHRPQYGSPWQTRKGQSDSSQWQMYREGLKSDRRILENLQDKLNDTDSM